MSDAIGFVIAFILLTAAGFLWAIMIGDEIRVWLYRRRMESRALKEMRTEE